MCRAHAGGKGSYAAALCTRLIESYLEVRLGCVVMVYQCVVSVCLCCTMLCCALWVGVALQAPAQLRTHVAACASALCAGLRPSSPAGLPSRSLIATGGGEV